MPQRKYRINFMPKTAREVELITAFQSIFDDISMKLAEVQGFNGRQFSVNNDINMNGQRITGVPTSRTDDDIVGRRELKERALYVGADNKHHTQYVIMADGGLQVPTAEALPDAVPLSQLRDGLAESVTLDTAQTITGDKTFTGSLILGAIFRLSTGNAPAVNGSQNNLALPTAVYIQLTGPTAVYTLTGLAGGVAGRLIVLYNTVAFTLTLNHEDAASTAANRLHFFVAAPMTVPPNTAVLFVYDSTLSRWVYLTKVF